MSVLLYLALGILSDLLVTGYYLCVSHGRAWYASGLSMSVTLLSLFVLGSLLGSGMKWYSALAYALGNAIGCFAIMRWRGRGTCKSNGA